MPPAPAGPALPTPDMNDVCIYATEDLILGQVVGALVEDTTYYLDMACAVHSGEYADANWPDPAPELHIELWRIPDGVTDGQTIYTGISGADPDYTKIAEAYTDATGNISGGSGAITPAPASKWQLIGTIYTGTVDDTNVYVRLRGSGGAAVMPEYAFSDAYLSTEKRLVPGGDITYDIDPGMTYDVAGPYTCTHGSLMGTTELDGDINGDCFVNLVDFALLAAEWLGLAF